MTPEQAAAVGVLIAAHDQQRTSLVARLIALLLGTWRSRVARQGARVLYDQRAALDLAVELADLSIAGQRQAANLTAEFQRQTLTVIGGRPGVRPVTLPAYVRDGVDPVDVYDRAAGQFRYQQSTGVDDVRALQLAEQRLESIVDHDVQRAESIAEQAVLEDDPRVVGWRRVIRPELSRTGTCGLCIVAADRLYSRGDLKPIHGRCNCRVLPVMFDGEDPGQELNAEDLDALYAAVGSNRARDLKRVRIQVDTHSELGPTLREAGDRVTVRRRSDRDSADDAARAQRIAEARQRRQERANRR